MIARSRYYLVVTALAALCLVGFTALVLAPSAPVGAASPAASAPRFRVARPLGRPSYAVAYASPSVVRVLTYYYGTPKSGNAGFPPVVCAGTGVLVGTTGPNSFNYVLTATSLLNPLVPCEGVQAAFQQIDGPAQSWGVLRVEVWLDAAYTGASPKQLGAIQYQVDPSEIATTGQAFAPTLSLIALSPLAHAPNHDLPVLQTPQPSNPPAGPQRTVIDLGGADGSLLDTDSLAPHDVAASLYPLAVDAAQLGQETPPPQTPPAPPTVPQQTVIGGTAVPTATATATTVPATPSPLSAQVSLGAPVVDSNGSLVGMVVADAAGNHVVAPLSAINGVINPVSGTTGTAMAHWQQGLAAFYGTPANYTAAASALTALGVAAPDFAGAAPYLAAAKARTTNVALPGVAPSATPTAGTPTTLGHGGGLGYPAFLIAVGVAFFVVLLGAVLLVFRLLQLLKARRDRDAGPDGEGRRSLFAPLAPPALPAGGASGAVDELPTSPQRTPLPPGRPAPAPSVPRDDGGPPARFAAPSRPSAPPGAPSGGDPVLAPQWAGLTDSGRRRAAEPNQDNILAVTGTHLGGGHPQPYGLFIVADGMGGHSNGQEASRRAIEVIAGHLAPPLNSARPLDGAAIGALLREAATMANADLRERNAAVHGDMGTTLTAALVVGGVAYIANVGDSRTYVFTPAGGLRLVTRDHSIVASLVANGVIRPEEIYTHPRRNQIYRSLGGQHEDAEVDLFAEELHPDDGLLLCSDGLWEMVRDPQLEAILRASTDIRQAAEQLVQAANDNGGEDNISVIVVRMVAQPASGQMPPGLQVAAPQDAPWHA